MAPRFVSRARRTPKASAVTEAKSTAAAVDLENRMPNELDCFYLQAGNEAQMVFEAPTALIATH